MELSCINIILKKRDSTIDILRGFAIIIMIGANMIPYLLKGTPPVFLRLYGSFAAPTFIFLSGMMVSFTISKGKYSAAHFFKKGIKLFIIGALIDVFITGIYPFMTFDVLYLIGISTVLTFLFKKLKVGIQYIVVLTIFTMTPLIQNLIGYGQIPVAIPLSISMNNITTPINVILRQWLIDGWFPILPWLGFAFLGSIGADVRLKYRNFTNIMTLFLIFLILIPGEVLWVKYPGQMFIRNGYAELFYPPTPGFMLISIGVILLLFYIVDLKNTLIIYMPFSLLGKWSLHIYVIHLIIITLFGKLIGQQRIGIFLLFYLGIVSILLVLFNAIEKIRHK